MSYMNLLMLKKITYQVTFRTLTAKSLDLYTKIRLSQEQEARSVESGEKRQLLTTPTCSWRHADCSADCSVHTLTVSSEEQVATADESNVKEAHHTLLECPINAVIEQCSIVYGDVHVIAYAVQIVY